MFGVVCVSAAEVEIHGSVGSGSVAVTRQSRALYGRANGCEVMRFDLAAVGALKLCCLTVLLAVLMLPVLRRLGLRAFSMASDSYSSGTHSAAFVTCPNDTVAKELARGIVEKKLAACVNIVPQITSVYLYIDTIRYDYGFASVISLCLVDVDSYGVTLLNAYEWQGKIEEDSEVLLMIKTRSSKIPALAEYVRSNHPYEVAEVISLPIDQGNPPYLKWIGDIVPE
ncbi:hypothetical protein H4Q32_011639 [Labeo rohita]|uniref:CutA-like protein n=1 Tax=Labeo rohita TaxID=84645 RepID=A0ABQ8MJY6_LABRO|nr:hypothetical protein H4Q32_011639 [Labeo rohita]